MNATVLAISLALTSSVSLAIPPITQIDDQRADSTALINGIALLANYYAGGLKAVSISGAVQLIDEGHVSGIYCNSSLCFFGASLDSFSGKVWQTDGTPSGTRSIADFPDGAVGVEAIAGDVIYAQVGGLKPRVVEIAADGAVRVIFQGYSNFDLVASQESVAFSTNQNFGRMIRVDRGGVAIDLGRYVSNGTQKPVALVGDTLIFAMETPATGTELWRHRRGETTPTLIRDFAPGPVGSFPELITPYENGLYLKTALGMYSLAPPFSNPLPVPSFGVPFRIQVGHEGLAIQAQGGGLSRCLFGACIWGCSGEA